MDWQTTRNQFMRTIGGDPPGAQLEEQLIAAYTQNPEAVERSLEKIALAFKAGKIRSPWGAVKAEVAKAVDAARNPGHTKNANRNAAVQRAEQRIRNELLHYDRWNEVEDELFGPRGTLKAHDTPGTRARARQLWDELRPLGEKVEEEADMRGRAHQSHKAVLKAALADPKLVAARKAAE